MQAARQLTLAAVALVAVAAAGAMASWTPPKYCNGLDCPRFEVLSSNATTNVEVRRYEAAQWVSTNLTGVDYDQATSAGFRRLFRYISGANEQGVKVEMAAPVLVDVYPGAGPSCNSTFVVSFFVPFSYQGKAPAPSSPDVYLRTLPPCKVAVRQYSGYAPWSAAQPQLTALAEQLQRDGVAFDQTFETTAGYDSPFKVFGRHNEVRFALQ